MFPHMGVGSFLSLVWYSTNGIVSFAMVVRVLLLAFSLFAFKLYSVEQYRTGPTATPRSPAKE